MSCGHGLDHRALVYETPEQFLATAEPFVREGIAREHAVVVIAAAANEAALRESLGGEAEAVDFHAPADWYVTPPRTLAAYTRCIAGVAAGSRIRALGEIAFPDRSDAVVREWARAEAIVGAAFAQAPVDMICPYNAGLPDAILEHARRTHPSLCDGASAVPNPDAVDPYAFLRRIADQLDEPPAPVAELMFDEDPSVARRFVGEQARSVGVRGEQLEALALAVSELATNAILHGRAPRRVRTWLVGHRIVCEVEDAGRGIDSPLAGYVMPGPEAASGRGLWLARQLCDLVEICGPRVRLHLAAC